MLKEIQVETIAYVFKIPVIKCRDALRQESQVGRKEGSEECMKKITTWSRENKGSIINRQQCAS